MMQEMLHRRLSRLTAAEHTAAQLSGKLVETYEAQDELAEAAAGAERASSPAMAEISRGHANANIQPTNTVRAARHA
jgi:hypothetical protein